MADAKDPIRVRTGRLGALAVHSRGRTNTEPARAAFRERFRRQVDPDGTLPTDERERRADFAMREYMTRMAMHRHREKATKSAAKASAA